MYVPGSLAMSHPWAWRSILKFKILSWWIMHMSQVQKPSSLFSFNLLNIYICISFLFCQGCLFHPRLGRCIHILYNEMVNLCIGVFQVIVILWNDMWGYLIKMDIWGIGERSICMALFNTNTFTSHLRLGSLGILLWSPICVDGAKQLQII
jgi:hypothetical protein